MPVRWRLWIGFSGMVGMLLLVVVKILFFGGGLAHIREMQQSEAELPNMRVQDIHLMEQSDSGNEWELWAQEANFYDAKHVVTVGTLRAQLLGTADQSVYLMADHGQIDRSTGNMTARGHVLLQYLSGYTIETDVLVWQAASRVVQTDAAVKIENALVRIVGVGMQGNIDEQRFLLQDDVHAAFQLR